MAANPSNKPKSALDRWEPATAFALAALIGAVLWAASPWVTGQKEPWDAQGGYYFLGLLVGGFVGAVLRPVSPVVTAAGLVVGQFVAIIATGGAGPLIVFGLLFLSAYGLLGLVGAWLGCRLRAPHDDKPFGI